MSTATRADGRFLLDVVAGRDGISHQIDQQGFTGDHHRLDMISKGSEHLYVQEGVDMIYDQGGNELVHEGSTWTAVDAGGRRRSSATRATGRIEELHDAIRDQRFGDTPSCAGESVKLARRAREADRYDARIGPCGPRADARTSCARSRSAKKRSPTPPIPDAAAPEDQQAADLLGRGQVDDLVEGPRREHDVVHRVAAHRRPVHRRLRVARRIHAQPR